MALDHDVAHLMDALPALARTLRYGDVRRTDLPALRHVTDGLITRICVGLPAAVGGLDDAAAAGMRDRIDAVHAAIALLDDAEATARWHDVLAALSTRDDLHGLLSGRLNRLLLDAGLLDVAEAGRRMALVLTVGVPVARAAAWIEGFLTGDGLLLVHDERLLRLVDGWLTGIPPEAFVEALPLLRRTFSEYPAPQRRQIGERAVRLGDAAAGAGRPTAAGRDVDAERADLVMPDRRGPAGPAVDRTGHDGAGRRARPAVAAGPRRRAGGRGHRPPARRRRRGDRRRPGRALRRRPRTPPATSAAAAAAASTPPRPGWPAGWATSGATSRRPWCR